MHECIRIFHDILSSLPIKKPLASWLFYQNQFIIETWEKPNGCWEHFWNAWRISKGFSNLEIFLINWVQGFLCLFDKWSCSLEFIFSNSFLFFHIFLDDSTSISFNFWFVILDLDFFLLDFNLCCELISLFFLNASFNTFNSDLFFNGSHLFCSFLQSNETCLISLSVLDSACSWINFAFRFNLPSNWVKDFFFSSEV